MIRGMRHDKLAIDDDKTTRSTSVGNARHETSVTRQERPTIVEQTTEGLRAGLIKPCPEGPASVARTQASLGEGVGECGGRP